MSTTRSDAISNTDESILRFLRAERAHYPALIASNTGLHVTHVERRCVELSERGLVEPVSDEVVYRITERGVRRLEQS